jgi:hypothetical protein
MDSRNAQTRVFSITEIVEAILRQADMSPVNLLLVRRINRTFNDVILHALPFRRALFLELDETRTELETEPSNIEMNPFREQIFSEGAKFYFDLVLGRTKNRLEFIAQGRDVLVGQGKVCKRCYSKCMDLASLEDDRCYLHLPLIETHDEEGFFTPAQWCEHAIWRKMYATRPALLIHIVHTSPMAHRWAMAPATTLGEIISAVVLGKVVFSTPEN